MDSPLDDHSMLALAGESRASAERAFTPDGRLIYGTWAAAWIGGFLLLWIARRDNSAVDATLAGWLFGTAQVAAIALTAAHIGRRVHGIAGPSAVVGRRWSQSFFAAFLMFGLIVGAVHSIAPAAAELLSPVLACGLVGVLYTSGGLAFGDTVQYRLGAWITLAAGGAALAGTGPHLLVLAVAGGGGFLAAALIESRLQSSP